MLRWLYSWLLRPDPEAPPDEELVDLHQQEDEDDGPDPEVQADEEHVDPHQQQDEDHRPSNVGDLSTNSTVPIVPTVPHTDDDDDDDDECGISRGIPDDDWMLRTAVRLTRKKTGLFQEKDGRTVTATTHAEKTEDKVDNALDMGDFHFIKAEVNPKALIDCKTNVLLKAFEVNIKLNKKRDPEKVEFITLADAVDEFATTLIDPLKSDVDTRNCYRSGLDYAVDRAIDLKQKKFIAHTVVDDLLWSKWYGCFLPLLNTTWTNSGRWKCAFLDLWALVDLVMFPLLFAIFFIIHLIKRSSRKSEDSGICFVLALSQDAMSKDVISENKTGVVLSLIRETVQGVIRTYGYRPAKYCVIQRGEEHIRFDTPFDNENSLLEKVNKIEIDEKSSPLLHNDLDKVLDAFESSKASKKILVVFVNDKVATTGPNENETETTLKEKLNKLREKGVQLIPIGIGKDARLDELKELREFTNPESDEGRVGDIKDSTLAFEYLFGEYEPSEQLTKAIVQGIDGKDMYERYLEYFTTPCFIFVRDTLSNLVLLGLLFDICLSPSHIGFSGLEWIIFVFFLGRTLMEVDQFNKRSFGETTNKGTWLKRIIYHFSDTWNWLDLFILITYIITFTLRMISWGVSVSVADNRLLAVAEHLYGLVTMLLTLRTSGHAIEAGRKMGAIQIALFSVMVDMFAIFSQFMAAILAFSLIITKVYVAERSYLAARNGTEELVCSTAGFDCWLFVTKHLAWSVIGIAELEPLHSVDGFSLNLVHFLYSLFLIIGAILLVNMMIALLSNTYQRVEDNSQKEWSFKKAVSIRTYCEYHPVPVPLTLYPFQWLNCLSCAEATKHKTEMKTWSRLKERKWPWTN